MTLTMMSFMKKMIGGEEGGDQAAAGTGVGGGFSQRLKQGLQEMASKAAAATESTTGDKKEEEGKTAGGTSSAKAVPANTKPFVAPEGEEAECCICFKTLSNGDLGVETCVVCGQHVCADCTSYGASAQETGEGFKCCFCKKKSKDGPAPSSTNNPPDIKVTSANSEPEQAQKPPPSEKSTTKPLSQNRLSATTQPTKSQSRTSTTTTTTTTTTTQPSNTTKPRTTQQSSAKSQATGHLHPTNPQSSSTNATKPPSQPHGRSMPPSNSHLAASSTTKSSHSHAGWTDHPPAGNPSEYSSCNKDASHHHSQSSHHQHGSSRNPHHHHHQSSSVGAYHSSTEHPGTSHHHPQHYSSSANYATNHHHHSHRSGNPSSSSQYHHRPENGRHRPPLHDGRSTYRSSHRHHSRREAYYPADAAEYPPLSSSLRRDPPSAFDSPWVVSKRPYDSASSLEDYELGRRRRAPRDDLVPKRRSASCDRSNLRRLEWDNEWNYNPYFGITNPRRRVILQRDPQDGAYGAGGLGIRVVGGVTGLDGRLFAEITWILPGGVADRSGLREGDRIIEWDGEVLTGLSFEEVTEVIARSRHIVELLVERSPAAMSYDPLDITSELEREHRKQFPGRRLLPESPGAEVGLQLWYEPKRQELMVTVVEARCLVRSHGDNLPPRAFVQLRLLPSGDTVRSHVAPPSINPEWRKTLVFPHILPDEVVDSVLEVTVWDHKTTPHASCLGEVRIPLHRHDLQNYLDWFPLSPGTSSTPAHDRARMLLKQRRAPLFQSRSLNDDYYSPEEDQELIRYSSLNFPYYPEDYTTYSYPPRTKHRASSLERHSRLNYPY